jgi:hypothetical protein
VNRVKRPDRFSRKRMSRAFDNVRTDSPQVPMGSRSIQARSAIGSRDFIDFAGFDGTDQYAIALNERKVGGRHEFSVPKYLAHGVAGVFSEQPGQHGARFRINIHCVPRSALRSSAA